MKKFLLLPFMMLALSCMSACSSDDDNLQEDPFEEGQTDMDGDSKMLVPTAYKMKRIMINVPK